MRLAAGAAWLLAAAVTGLGPAAVSAAPEPGDVAPVRVGWRASAALARGVELWAGGRHRAALDAFTTAAREHPADPVAWHDLGVALLAASRYEEALDAFGHERFHAPIAPSAHLGLGRCLLALGHPAEAENEFVMAVTEAPTVGAGWRWLSAARVAQGKTALARMTEAAGAPLRAHPRRVGWSAATISNAITRLRFPALPAAALAPPRFNY